MRYTAGGDISRTDDVTHVERQFDRSVTPILKHSMGNELTQIWGWGGGVAPFREEARDSQVTADINQQRRRVPLVSRLLVATARRMSCCSRN